MSWFRRAIGCIELHGVIGMSPDASCEIMRNFIERLSPWSVITVQLHLNRSPCNKEWKYLKHRIAVEPLYYNMNTNGAAEVEMHLWWEKVSSFQGCP